MTALVFKYKGIDAKEGDRLQCALVTYRNGQLVSTLAAIEALCVFATHHAISDGCAWVLEGLTWPPGLHQFTMVYDKNKRKCTFVPPPGRSPTYSDKLKTCPPPGLPMTYTAQTPPGLTSPLLIKVHNWFIPDMQDNDPYTMTSSEEAEIERLMAEAEARAVERRHQATFSGPPVPVEDDLVATAQPHREGEPATASRIRQAGSTGSPVAAQARRVQPASATACSQGECATRSPQEDEGAPTLSVKAPIAGLVMQQQHQLDPENGDGPGRTRSSLILRPDHQMPPHPHHAPHGGAFRKDSQLSSESEGTASSGSGLETPRGGQITDATREQQKQGPAAGNEISTIVRVRAEYPDELEWTLWAAKRSWCNFDSRTAREVVSKLERNHGPEFNVCIACNKVANPPHKCSAFNEQASCKACGCNSDGAHSQSESHKTRCVVRYLTH